MRHNREEVIERTILEFQLLDQLVANLKEEDWEQLVPRPESKDPWTVKDTLAHITHWKADVIRSIHAQRRPAGSRDWEKASRTGKFTCAGESSLHRRC